MSTLLKKSSDNIKRVASRFNEIMDTFDTEFIDIKKYVQSEIIIKDEPLEDSSENQKCGEIFSFNGRQFTFSCFFCSLLFTEYELFTNHILGEHSKLFPYDDTEQNPDLEKVPPKDVSDSCMEKGENLLEEIEASKAADIQSSSKCKTTLISCDFCKKSFRTKIGLSRHKKRHETKTDESNEAQVPTMNPKENQKSAKTYNCNECGLIFYRQYTLKLHERTHTEELPFQCEICKKCFRLNYLLKRHAFTHISTRPYKCSHCSSAFNHPANLAVHIRRLHLNERRHKCDFCDKAFVTSSEKTGHMRVHTEEKPYQCEKCGSKFRMSFLLTIHKRIRHSEERNFVCKECGKTFKTKGVLKNHMITHSDARPFECKTCGNSFARRKALNTHEKLHSDVKEYVCKICGKEFAQNAGLYSHMKSHKVDN